MRLRWIAWLAGAGAERLVVCQERLGTWGFYHYQTASGISKEGLNIGMAAVNLRCVT